MIGYDAWTTRRDYREFIDGTCVGGPQCGATVPHKDGNPPLRFEAVPGVWYYRTDGYTKDDRRIYKPE